MFVNNCENLYVYYPMQRSQAHREHYTDKSGTVQKVNYFQIPTRAEDQFKKNLPL